MSAEAQREEFSPDENRQLEAAKRLYERALDTAAASRRIVSVDDPCIVLERDGNGKPIRFGEAVPSWDTVRPSKGELVAIGKLQEPVGVISIPALSLRTQVAVGRALERPLNVWSGWDLESDENGDLVEWRPENPKKGRTKEQRLNNSAYTGAGVDVIFQDGGPEVHDSTLRLDAFDMRELCKEQGLIQPDTDAYLALQLEGARDRKPFDAKTFSWLDAYLKSVRSAVYGGGDPDGREVFLYLNDPELSVPGLGGRRAVRVKKKI